MTSEEFERFQSKYTPHPITGCWNWTAHKNNRGYGSFCFQGRVQRAHRVSYEHFVGSLDGLLCCHHCDNPSCVNPDHLFKGTQFDNMRDCSRKRRIVVVPKIGTLHHFAKLNEASVVEMRQRHGSGESIRSLGRRFGIRWESARSAIRRETWKHVA